MHGPDWSVAIRPLPYRSEGGSAADRWRASRLGNDPGQHPSPEQLPLEALVESLSEEEAVAHRWNDEQGEAWDLVVLRSDGRLFVMTRQAQGPEGRLGELALVYTTLARSRDAVVFTDVSGTLLGASPRWRKLYGYELEEILGGNPRLINSRLHSRAFFQNLWEDLTRRDVGTWSGELVNRKRNGELAHVWQTITAFRGPGESIIGYLGIARDLTSHHEMQDRLFRSTQELDRKDRLKDEQLTTVVHDLRSPLHGILGHLDLALENLERLPHHRLAAHLESARGAARRMTTLVGSLLDLRRLEAGQLRIEVGRVAVHTLLRASVELHSAWAAKKAVRFELSEQGPSRPAFVDEMRLEEVIANLLSNAVRYSPQGGHVRVGLEVSGDGRHRIRIDDEGPGIPESELETIFERNRQLEPGQEPSGSDRPGIGWGLAISRSILEMHGGGIRAGRSPQGGCRMEFEFPSNWSALSERIWAAAVFDPNDCLWPAIEPRLHSLALPCFVAASEADLHRLFDHELPNLYLRDAAAAPLASPPTFPSQALSSKDTLLDLAVAAPATARNALRIVAASGPLALRRSALELFPELAPGSNGNGAN